MSYDSNILWQDRQVIFDVSKSQFVFRQGEESYKTMSNIEDLKGSNEIGTFIFTNLRLIWYNNKNPKINQSIGYDCIENIEKNLSNILKLYEQGRLYREFKQNNENICNKNDKSLVLLKDEKIIEKVKNIYLESSNDKDNTPGDLYKTNIRMVWINNKNSSFNLTFPWIQISSINGEMNEKFGISLRIKLSKFYNNTSFLFYSKEGIINKEFCENLNKIMNKLLENPILSISLKSGNEGEAAKDKFKEKIGKIADMVYGQEEIADKNEDDQAGMIYLINEGRNKQNNINNIEFSKELGIACEKLPEKVTIADLWKIIK